MLIPYHKRPDFVAKLNLGGREQVVPVEHVVHGLGKRRHIPATRVLGGGARSRELHSSWCISIVTCSDSVDKCQGGVRGALGHWCRTIVVGRLQVAHERADALCCSLFRGVLVDHAVVAGWLDGAVLCSVQ